MLDLTSVPPVPRVYGGAPADEYLALQQFSRDLQAAVPVLRAATGKVLSEQREPSPTAGGQWLVSLALYSGVDGQADRPLLELSLTSSLSAG